MKKNNLKNNSRTKDNADESLSQSENILNDIKNIFDEEDFSVAPLFDPN